MRFYTIYQFIPMTGVSRVVNKFSRYALFTLFVFLMSGCSSFSGIRNPRYDGKPFEVSPEKIEAFQNGREVIGEEKEYYIRQPLSTDITNPSLEYENHAPFLLEGGTYTIGEDFPSGRVTIVGRRSNPESVMQHEFGSTIMDSDFEVGTLTIRDEIGDLYFENMFHPHYGVNTVQVDFIEGHTIEFSGQQPFARVFYAEELPEDSNILDESQVAVHDQQEEIEIVENEGIEIFLNEQEQPINRLENDRIIELKAGIYEAGKHFEAGTYEITEQSAPTQTELFLFREGEEPRVFEISENLYGLYEGFVVESHGMAPDLIEPGTIELLPGDKIYPHYVNYLMLTKID